MKFILCLLLIGGITYSSSACPGNLSNHECLILEQFFQTLVKYDGLGYTLFGSKPVCLASYLKITPLGNLLDGCNYFAIKRGWQVWQKLDLNHPQFIILAESSQVNGYDVCYIFFINKANLLKTLTQCADIFAKELGTDFQAGHFLAQIEQEKSLLRLINYHEGLLGILLGYGVESSMHYYQRNLVWQLGLPLTYNDSDFESFSEALDSPFLVFIQPIAFSASHGSHEVQLVSQHNSHERNLLCQIYCDYNFLKISTQRLITKK